jgi:DNA-binding response OmpR family regulator
MQSGTHILVVEDEPKIRTGLTDFLQFHKFAVTVAEDGLAAERLVEQQSFDLILLDLMLPKISGEQLCTRWRQEGRTVPVIMLTAKGQQDEKIAGLDLGADDYITKPFSLEELLARIQAVLRRTDPARSVTRSFALGPVAVDIAALKIRRDGKEHPITRREADLIRFFAANPGRVISREELYRQVWHDSLDDIETRTVDMHIAKLRNKLETNPADPRIIKTVRGAGYLYEG